MNESHQKDGMEEFRALAEFYRALVEEADRSSALLHEARQRRPATRDGGASWTQKPIAVRGESG